MGTGNKPPAKRTDTRIPGSGRNTRSSNAPPVTQRPIRGSGTVEPLPPTKVTTNGVKKTTKKPTATAKHDKVLKPKPAAKLPAVSKATQTRPKIRRPMIEDEDETATKSTRKPKDFIAAATTRFTIELQAATHREAARDLLAYLET